MPRQLNKEEEAQIFKFFAEESENATSPFELNSFYSKFRKKYTTDIGYNDLKVIFFKLRLKIHEKNEYGMDLRVRMMFALRVPVNPEFLVVLRKNAEVEVNQTGRIISYKKYDGELELVMKSKSKVSNKKSKIENSPTMPNAQIGNLREEHQLESLIVNESIIAQYDSDETDKDIENTTLNDSSVDPSFSLFSDGPSSSNRSKRNTRKRERYSPILIPDKKQKKPHTFKSTSEKSSARYSSIDDLREHRFSYLNADGSGPSLSDVPMKIGLGLSSSMTQNYFAKPDDFSSGPIILEERNSEGSSYFTTSLIQTHTQHFPESEIISTHKDAQNEVEDDELVDIETVSEDINSELREEEQCRGNVSLPSEEAANTNEKSTEIEEYRNNMDCKVQREDSGIGGCDKSTNRNDNPLLDSPFHRSFAESQFLATSEVPDERIDEQETDGKDCEVLIEDSGEREDETNLENAQKQNDSIPVNQNILIESSERNGNQDYSGEESPEIVSIKDILIEEIVSTIEANVSIRASDLIENVLDSTGKSSELASNKSGNENQESSEIGKEAVGTMHNDEIQKKQKSVSRFRFALKRPKKEVPEERSSILASFQIQNPMKRNETAVQKSATRIDPRNSISSVETASTKSTKVDPPEKISKSSIPNSKVSIKDENYTEHSLIPTAPGSYEKSKRAPIRSEENPEDVRLSSSEMDSIDSTFAYKKPKSEFLTPKREPQTEEDSSKPMEWFIYSKALLHQLRAIIITLDSPLLVDLRKAVEDNFSKIKDKKIPIQGIISVLQTLLYVTVNSAKPEENTNSSLSLKSFLTVLRHTINNFEISDLSAFGEEIKQEINKIGKDDKTVSIEKIRPAFETILLLTKI